MIRKTIIALGLTVGIGLMGCQQSEHSSDPVSDAPHSAESDGRSTGPEEQQPGSSVLICSSDSAEKAIKSCIGDEDSFLADDLLLILQKWSTAQEVWSGSLLDSGSLLRRHPLNLQQKNCLKEYLCKEVKYESL